MFDVFAQNDNKRLFVFLLFIDLPWNYWNLNLKFLRNDFWKIYGYMIINYLKIFLKNKYFSALDF